MPLQNTNNRQDIERQITELCIRVEQWLLQNKTVSSEQFEQHVEDLVITQFGLYRSKNQIKTTVSRSQVFPDIPLGNFGIEIKFTTSSRWRCITNSINETHRDPEVTWIYVIYGKTGGNDGPQVRFRRYEECVVHVRTTHDPRFEVDMEAKPGQSLFDRMGITYERFSQLTFDEKMDYVRAYSKSIHPDEKLWWWGDSADIVQSGSGVVLYTSLGSKTNSVRRLLRAETLLLCPEIFLSGRSRHKYDRAALYLITRHNVLCHQARDLFSAGSVANPNNMSGISNYVLAAAQNLQQEIVEAAGRIESAFFLEYWGEIESVLHVPAGSLLPSGWKVLSLRSIADKLTLWLRLADACARTYRPSEALPLVKQAADTSQFQG